MSFTDSYIIDGHLIDDDNSSKIEQTALIKLAVLTISVFYNLININFFIITESL